MWEAPRWAGRPRSWVDKNQHLLIIYCEPGIGVKGLYISSHLILPIKLKVWQCDLPCFTAMNEFAQGRCHYASDFWSELIQWREESGKVQTRTHAGTGTPCATQSLAVGWEWMSGWQWLSGQGKETLWEVRQVLPPEPKWQSSIWTCRVIISWENTIPDLPTPSQFG